MDTLFYLADQNPHRDRSRGITEYTRRLIKGLGNSGEFDITCLVSKSSYQGEDDARKITIPFRSDHGLGRLTADFFHPLWVPGQAHVHYPKGFSPGISPRADFISGTIHDMILPYYMEHYPEARSKIAYGYWLRAIKRSVSRFELILTNSETSAEAIRGFCARYKVSCPPIRVTYLASRWKPGDVQNAVKEDFVVHLGSSEPHKRTETLLRCWPKAARTGVKLVVVGSLTTKARELAATTKLVELLPPLSASELKSLLTRARALIISSEIEGFGLPALESYALGTPAIYVKNTAVEEVLGKGTPGGFELSDMDSLGEAVESVLSLSPPELSAISARLAAKYSWEKCTAQTIAAFREAFAQI